MSERPLSEVILCCTSVTQDQRSAIVRQAVDMGAVSQADLTSDVTHLVVANVQTEKYKFAARHRTDLKLLTVEWVPAIHALWMSGKDVDLPQLERKFALPVFYGLRICVTNLDIETRQNVEKLVTANGGVYTGDLTKENTHLIAGAATGKKWEAVKSWQSDINLVAVEWLYESLKRGASLDEKYFSLEMAKSLRGSNSWFPQRPTPFGSDDLDHATTEKRKRAAGQIGHKRRLTKRASGLTNEDMWTNILANESTNSMLNANDSIIPPPVNLDLPTLPHMARDVLMSEAPNVLLPEDLTAGIFDNVSFHVTGFPTRETNIVKHTLTSNGGAIVSEEADEVVTIVPQNGHPPIQKFSSTIVTEFWLERCLALHAFENPTMHFLSTPFDCVLPIARMDQISVCISGFSGVDLLHLEKMVRKIGAIYHETLTAGRSILIASTRECRKFQAAKLAGMRIVGIEWLWECIRRGKMVGIADFALDGILGSDCRIDVDVNRMHRRRSLLTDVLCYIDDSYNGEAGKLINLAQSLGAQVATTRSDNDITHVVTSLATSSMNHDSGVVHEVSKEWLTDCFRLMARPPESAYKPNMVLNDENTPPFNVKEQRSTDVTNQRKLAREMHEIRTRISSAPVRRTSRKLLGRATTISMIDEAKYPSMLATNEDDRTIPVDMPVSQGVVYSDPDAAEERRRVLAKMGAVSTDGESNGARCVDKRISMRAVGLGDTRKLRR